MPLRLIVRLAFVAALLGTGLAFLGAQVPALENDSATERERKLQETRILTLESKLDRQERRYRTLEDKISRMGPKLEREGAAGIIVFLFGAFCALWAQNSGRSAVGWFFLGVFFNVITVLVLLIKNSNDRLHKGRY